jgi:hypothetical protein
MLQGSVPRAPSGDAPQPLHAGFALRSASLQADVQLLASNLLLGLELNPGGEKVDG